MSDSAFIPFSPKAIAAPEKALTDSTDQASTPLTSHPEGAQNTLKAAWPEPLSSDITEALLDFSEATRSDTSATEFMPLWQRVTSDAQPEASLAAPPEENWESQPFADESEVVTVEDVTVPETEAPLLNADEIEAIRKTAELEGYQAGFAKGEAHGLSSGESSAKAAWEKKLSEQQAEHEQRLSEQFIAKQQEVEAFAQLVHQLRAQAPSALQQYEQHLQTWLLDTVTHLTQAVVAHEIKKDAAHITQFIESGLKALPLYEPREDGKDLRICLHPDDLSRCLAAAQTDTPSSGWHWSNSLHTDPNLSVGDCRIVTPESQVSFCLEERLTQVCTEFVADAKEQL